jgi:hypothetical protein
VNVKTRIPLAKNSLSLLSLLLVMKLGQGAASKTKDIPLLNHIVVRWISDMAEVTETQFMAKIKKSKLFPLQLDNSTDIQNSSISLTYVRHERDMKEDTLSVSELSTHNTNKKIFSVSNGFTEERGLE